MAAVSTTERLHERCFHCTEAVTKNDCMSAAEATLGAAGTLLESYCKMKLYGRLAAHRYKVQRNVEKIRKIRYKLTNIRRNLEKIRQILYKRTNVRRNVEKIRQILYKPTNVRRNLEKIRQILYKPTNVRRNVEKIRQILYKRTTVRRNAEKIDKTNTVQTN